jgi:hypothetical protein
MYIRMQHPNYIYILAQRSSKTHMCKENENVHTVCPRTQGSGSNRCRDAYAFSKLNCSESATTSGRGWGPLSTYDRPMPVGLHTPLAVQAAGSAKSARSH